jgi:hypothetical protein
MHVGVREWPNQSWYIILGLIAAAIGVLVFLTGNASLGSFFNMEEGSDGNQAGGGIESDIVDEASSDENPTTPDGIETDETDVGDQESGSASDEYSSEEDDDTGQLAGDAQTVFYLADLDEVEGSPGSGVATMLNHDYSNSVWFGINTFQNDEKWATYVLPEGSGTFDATIGFSDDSEPGAKVHFQVFLDENPVDDGQSLVVGETVELPTVSVEGAHHLKIKITFLESGDVGPNGKAVWGGAKVEK